MLIRLDFADPQRGQARLRCAFEAPVHILVAHTPEQVQPLLDTVEAHAKAGRWCVGYLRYEAAGAFDAALVTHPADGPLAWFGVFERAQPWPDGSTAATSIAPTHGSTSADASGASPEGQPQAVASTTVHWHSPLSRAQFDTHLDTLHQAIGAGECYQVNYTAPLHGDFVGDTLVLFARLQQAQPGGYAAYIDTSDEQLLSVSPELFFDWDGQNILTRPMKGTAPRGTSPDTDARLAQSLTESPKERSENVMIVDLLRNDLSRIALPHTVQVPTLFAVQTLPTVHQMVSDVTAQTRPGTTLGEVFGALFPCGSITGAPKVRAMQTIQALEPQARGVYCGAIGVMRPGGHATFNVAIRTVTIRGNQARCGIGSGITYDATATNEWREWQHKRGFLERASEPFALLETLRLQAGVFHNLGAHLARLTRAARHFGYPYDEVRVCAALQTLANRPAVCLNDDTLGQCLDSSQLTRADQPAERTHNNPTVWRVRLLLDAQGTPFVEKFIQNNTPAQVIIGLAATPFEAAHSEFTRFKTTRRAHYEAFTPTDPAVFDTLLYNVRGELTECTRGNIAVRLDGQWLTPALHCGLLDGVGRVQLLSEGRITEAVITLDDLPRATGFAFVNSLRGWVDARLQPAASGPADV